MLLVHELHLRGHQRLRAIPAMEPSGKYWRCAIAPASLVARDHGARLVTGIRKDSRIATYSSRERDHYFSWPDVYPYATPQELAELFEDRFPDVVEAGRGSDWAYAGWYMEMLRLTHPDQFPYAMARGTVPDTYVPTASPGTGRPASRIALPPPGEASGCPDSVPHNGSDRRHASFHRVQRRTTRRLAG